MKKLLFILITSLVLCLAGCGRSPEAPNTIRVGTMSGPDEQVLEAAKEVARERYGLHIQIVQFNDYNLPNAALSDGSIDANIFQHKPYLDAAIQANHYKLVPIAKTFIFPMGIYSSQYKSIKAIPDKAVVAVPNDPSNEARALLLLQKAGLLTLKPGASVTATANDIANNPKHLQIKELDAAQLPRVLPDVAIAVINSNYAIPANLIPTRDAIFLEGKDSQYANLIVVRTADKDQPQFQALIKAMHSQEVLHAANKFFAGQDIPAWKK